MSFSLKFLGACGEVTGASVLLNTPKAKILLDCGMHQGEKRDERLTLNEEIDYFLLSHAHIDHSGLLPLLLKENLLKKRIISTRATFEVARVLLLDSAKLQQEELEKSNKPPLYTQEDVYRLFSFWDAYDYNQPFELDGVSVEFWDAGHILGSASILIRVYGKSLLYTGDLGTKLSQLMNLPKPPKGELDYLIIESTYGDRLHPKEEPLAELKAIIEKTIKRGGKVLIPAFAVGRAQEVLFALKRLKFTEYPVYLDSPMAESVTNLTDIFFSYLKPSFKQYFKRDESIFTMENLNFVRTDKRSKELAETKEPMVVIAASGMLEGGRVMNHLPEIIKDKNSTLLFIGYQAKGTLGRKIQDGERSISLNDNFYELSCEVTKLPSFSAHADRDELIQFIEKMDYLPYKTFIIHGEEDARNELSLALRKKRIRVALPELKEGFILGDVFVPPDMIELNFTPKFTEFAGKRIYPFVGAVIEEGGIKKVISREEFGAILQEEEEMLKTRTGEEIAPSITEEEELPEIDRAGFYKALCELRTKELLTKKKLFEFIEEAESGEQSVLAWLRIQVKKGRFQGSKGEQERIRQVLAMGVKSLGAITAAQIGQRVWDET